MNDDDFALLDRHASLVNLCQELCIEMSGKPQTEYAATLIDGIRRLVNDEAANA